MRSIVKLLSTYLTWLLQAFRMTPDAITRHKRGNLPPPSGGIGSY